MTEWCEAGHLRAGDRVVLHDHRAASEWIGEYTREQGYLLGLLVGDGTLKADKAVLSVWQPAAVATELRASCPAAFVRSWPKRSRPYVSCLIVRTSRAGTWSPGATNTGCLRRR